MKARTNDMGNKYGKIRESMDALNKKTTEIKRAQLKIQHGCPHNVDGDTNRCITVVRNNGNVSMKCERCGKTNITMTPPEASKFVEACTIIENGIDYIKIQQRESVDQEREILEKCADALDLLTAISKMYENLEHNGGKTKKHKDGENRRTSFALSSRSLLD